MCRRLRTAGAQWGRPLPFDAAATAGYPGTAWQDPRRDSTARRHGCRSAVRRQLRAKLLREGYSGYMIRATNDDMGDDV